MMSHSSIEIGCIFSWVCFGKSGITLGYACNAPYRGMCTELATCVGILNILDVVNLNI